MCNCLLELAICDALLTFSFPRSFSASRLSGQLLGEASRQDPRLRLDGCAQEVFTFIRFLVVAWIQDNLQLANTSLFLERKIGGIVRFSAKALLKVKMRPSEARCEVARALAVAVALDGIDAGVAAAVVTSHRVN